MGKVIDFCVLAKKYQNPNVTKEKDVIRITGFAGTVTVFLNPKEENTSIRHFFRRIFNRESKITKEECKEILMYNLRKIVYEDAAEEVWLEIRKEIFDSKRFFIEREQCIEDVFARTRIFKIQ